MFCTPNVHVKTVNLIILSVFPEGTPADMILFRNVHLCHSLHCWMLIHDYKINLHQAIKKVCDQI
uniref:Uncharacterized protein n=1 Tax=Anguilla anguilla TaxID=7936 RepID=A0A0E9XWG5_ANGAN